MSAPSENYREPSARTLLICYVVSFLMLAALWAAYMLGTAWNSEPPPPPRNELSRQFVVTELPRMNIYPATTEASYPR